MTKRAIVFLLTAWSLSSLVCAKTLIEFTIEAESDYSLATEGIEAEYYYSQATKRAELYCHQALGARAYTRLIKNWASITGSTEDEEIIIHNSRIWCTRNLDLTEEDPSIGTYMEHARWVLALFSGPVKDDHQLVENTIKILSQIGAPAIAVLWEDHVKQHDSATKITYFLCAIEEIIDTHSDDFSTFEAVFKLGAQDEQWQRTSDGELISFNKQKSRLLHRKQWPLGTFWHKMEELIITLQENTHDFGPFNSSIIMLATVLNGFYWALNEQVLRGDYDESNQKTITSLTCERLKELPTWVLNMSFETPIKEAIALYNCPY